MPAFRILLSKVREGIRISKLPFGTKPVFALVTRGILQSALTPDWSQFKQSLLGIRGVPDSRLSLEEQSLERCVRDDEWQDWRTGITLETR
jgi:hypothetical protein